MLMKKDVLHFKVKHVLRPSRMPSGRMSAFQAKIFLTVN